MKRNLLFNRLKKMRGIAISLMIIGLFFVLFGFSEQLRAARLAKKCRGEAVGIVTSYQSRYEEDEKRTYYDPVVTFTDEDGNMRSVTFTGTTSVPAKGVEMKVFYDPASDLAVSYHSLHPDADALFVFKLFGGSIAGVGLLLLIVSLLPFDKLPGKDQETK